MAELYLGYASTLTSRSDKPNLPDIHYAYFLGKNRSTLTKLKNSSLAVGEWTSIAKLLDDSTSFLRSPYIDFIGGLSVQNQSKEWWSTELANKNPTISSLFFQVCLLDVARKISTKSTSPSLLVAEEPEVYEALRNNLAFSSVLSGIPVLSRISRIPPFALAKYAFGRIRFVLSFIKRKFIARRSGDGRVNLLLRYKLPLLFTWLDGRNFDESGKYLDPHWGPALDLLRPGGVAVVPRTLPSMDFKESVDRLVSSGERFLLLESVLTLLDILKAFLISLRYRPEAAREIKMNELDISDLYRGELHRELLSTISVYNLLHYYFVKRLSCRGIPLSRVLITMEGQGWERALLLGLRMFYPGVPVLAFDNMTLSKMYISMYPSRKEFDHIPLPDRILTHGPARRGGLVENGYPEKSVVHCGYLRDETLWKREPIIERDFESNKCHVLIAPSIDLDDTLELLEKVLGAFSHCKGYRFTVKVHPLVSQEYVIQTLGDHFIRSGAQFTAKPVSEICRSVHVLIHTFTTVSLDALCFGIPAIFVQSEHRVNMNKLDVIRDYSLIAATPDEIRNTVDEVFGWTSDTWREWALGARAAAKSILGSVESASLAELISLKQ